MDDNNRKEIIDNLNASGVLDLIGHSKSDTLDSLLESQAKDLCLETFNSSSDFEDALIPDPLRIRTGTLGFLPIAKTIAANTIGLDLVAVKPLTGTDFYYDNYKKKPRLPRKKKKYVIRTIGRETYTKWINRHEWDNPYRRCSAVPIKRQVGLQYIDFKFDL